MEKEIKFKEGFSISAWKSLVVKSLRIGWVEGLEKVSTVLCKSEIKQLLVAGIFEDLFPGSWDELNSILKDIESQNWISLCSYDTHHNRGYTGQFCAMEKEAVKNARKEGYNIMEQIVQPNSNLKWLNPRVFNCLYTWIKINPKDSGVKRRPLSLKYTGMPECILDGHTYEGKLSNKSVLLLSGHYDNHLKISEKVSSVGHWGLIRKIFAKELIISHEKSKQLLIF